MVRQSEHASDEIIVIDSTSVSNNVTEQDIATCMHNMIWLVGYNNINNCIAT